MNNGNKKTDHKSLFEEARNIQDHGGLKMPRLGATLKHGGGAIGSGLGALLGVGGPAGRFLGGAVGGFLGQHMGPVGEQLIKGLPLDKSKWDIMKERGHDDKTILRTLSNHHDKP